MLIASTRSVATFYCVRRNLYFAYYIIKPYLFFSASNCLKGLIALVSINCFSCIFAVHAQENFTGDALAEPFEIEFSLDDGEYALLRASQQSADYMLQLRHARTQKTLSVVDFSSYLGLNEVLIVKSSDCTECVLILVPNKSIDLDSPYSVTLKKSLIHAESKKRLRALLHLRVAGEYVAQSSDSEENDVNENLRDAVTELDKALSLLGDEHRDLGYHIILTKSQLLFRLEQSNQAKLGLNKIVASSVGKRSLFRAQALFEMAAFEQNAEREMEMYIEGTEIAAELGLHVVQAQGMNYQAIRGIRNSDFNTALASLNDAYVLASGEKNWRRVLDILHNLSWGNLRAGRFTKAVEYGTEQKLLAEHYNDEENVLWALYNLGLVYGDLGELHISDQFLGEAMKRLSPLTARNITSVNSLKAYVFLERAQRYLEMGAVDLAHDYVIKGISAFEKLEWPNRVADTKFLLGDIAHARGDTELAEASYKKALEYDLENSRTRSAGLRYLKLSALSLRKRDYKGAVEYQDKAISKIELIDDKKLMAVARSLKVELHHRLGQNDDAMRLAKQSQALIQAHGTSVHRARFAYRRALVHEALNEKEQGVRQLELARSIVDTQIGKVGEHKVKQEFLALFKDIYEASVRLSLAQRPDDFVAAIELVEAFKVRTLKEKIASIEVGKALGSEKIAVRANTIRAIRDAAADWYTKEGRKASGALASARRLSSSLEKLESSILKEKGSLDVSDLDLRLDKPELTTPGELIAYYFFGRDQSWLWVIVDGEITEYQLPDESTVAKLTEKFLAVISEPPSARRNVTAWRQQEIMMALSEIVLRPLEKHLSVDGVTKISVVAGGPLAGVPISALKLGGAKGYLVEKYAVEYLPSLSARTILRDSKKGGDNSKYDSILVVANPINSSYLGASLPPLPYTASEASAIKKIYGAKATVVESEAATRENFFFGVAQNPSIIHVATHGLMNNLEPSLSGLVFSASDLEDSLVLQPEISALGVDADLVVLSACESGIGKQVAGEGLLSLSRAFLESGVTKVVGSLWKVQDSSTAHLMKEFYLALNGRKMSVSAALKDAQSRTLLDLDNDWSDPYYWAGFQLVGR